MALEFKLDYELVFTTGKWWHIAAGFKVCTNVACPSQLFVHANSSLWAT